MSLLLVVVGAAIGASARYLMGGWIAASVPGGFPWGTLAVNLLGCLTIGVAWALGEHAGWSASTRAFIFVGVLGSFTTFSSFGLETMRLLQGGFIVQAAAYVSASNLIGLALVWAGACAVSIINS